MFTKYAKQADKTLASKLILDTRNTMAGEGMSDMLLKLHSQEINTERCANITLCIAKYIESDNSCHTKHVVAGTCAHIDACSYTDTYTYTPIL